MSIPKSNQSSPVPSPKRSFFKPKQPTIPEMVINQENSLPIIEGVAGFIANEFDKLNINFTVSHVRSAICRVKNINNTLFFDAVLEKLKHKPYPNLTSTNKQKKDRLGGGDELGGGVGEDESDKDIFM
jgi:hypothetical protein